MKEEHIRLAESLHDGYFTKDLQGMISSESELRKLNTHTGLDMTLDQFNEVVNEAIRMRDGD